MTVTTGKTTPEKTTTTPPNKGEAAVRHLYKQAVENGDEATAKLIATVSNLLKPEIKLTAAPAAPAKTADATVSVDGSVVDLTEMEDQDAADYAAYAKEMDGSAALERHIQRLEDEDAEMREIGRRNDGG